MILSHLLVDAVTGGGDPEFIEQRPATPVSRRQPKEAGPPHRHLPWPFPELSVGPVHDATLRLGYHGGHAALWDTEKVVVTPGGGS